MGHVNNDREVTLGGVMASVLNIALQKKILTLIRVELQLIKEGGGRRGEALPGASLGPCCHKRANGVNVTACRTCVVRCDT